MLLKNCRLVDALSDGVGGENCWVRTEGSLITEVGTGNPMVQADEETFDCAGKTLLPGLLDIHTHINGLVGFRPRDIEDPMGLFVNTAGIVRRYLDYGFTTIRDAGGCLRVNNHIRNAIEQGLLEGPRVISCGLILEPPETQRVDNWYPLYQEASGVEEFRAASRRELAETAEFIKIMASGSALQKTGIPTQPIMTEDEIRACVEIASMKGTYVAAHAHSSGSIKSCIKAGVRTIEHASFIDDEGIALLLKSNDCYLVPTYAAFYQNEEATRGTPYEYLIEKLRSMLMLSVGQIAKVYNAGVKKLGFGTDSSVGMDQYEQGIEFRFRKELCGMNDLDILMQATVYSAEIIGLENEIGSIKIGLCADLILVDGRPDEDISAMYRKPEAVWAKGKKVR